MNVDIYVGCFLLFILPCLASARNTNCYQCNSTAHPSLCTNVGRCLHKCLITKTVTAEGSTSYDMGCADNELCNSLTGSNVLIGKRQSRSYTECKACCHTTHCNNHCCNNTASLKACCHEAGYTYIPETDICVKLFKTFLSWDAAQGTCTEDNGHLLIIRNETELNAVRKHIDPLLANIQPAGQCATRHEIWIGANDKAHEGHFIWVNGQPFTAWQNQKLLKDDKNCDQYAHGADCTVINLHQDVWNDRHCEYTVPFVCQID